MICKTWGHVKIEYYERIIHHYFMLLRPWNILQQFVGSADNTPAMIGNASSPEMTSSGSKGTITCLIDGQQKAFAVQQSFFEISLGADSGKKRTTLCMACNKY
jgi:hypothetical protein